jgi:hypothetical protein
MKHKLESMCNQLNTKDASSKTLMTKINTIRCISNTDTFGNPKVKTWFDIVLPDEELTREFPASSIQVPTNTYPIVYSAGTLTKKEEWFVNEYLQKRILEKVCCRKN